MIVLNPSGSALSVSGVSGLCLTSWSRISAGRGASVRRRGSRSGVLMVWPAHGVSERRDSPTSAQMKTRSLLELQQLIDDVGVSIKSIDARRPQAANARTGALYQPGIGPHPETKAVALIVSELEGLFAVRYSGAMQTNISYPNGRQKCDLCVGASPAWDWAIEIKMLRLTLPVQGLAVLRRHAHSCDSRAVPSSPSVGGSP